jgi:hypothetical protein
MSDLGEHFVEALGRPDPVEPSGLTFPGLIRQGYWDMFYDQVGAGWFLDRFVYLFGPQAERLQTCLDAWPFLVPPSSDRRILGRNAHGAILVLEDASKVKTRVYLLDPFALAYWTDPLLQLESLLGRFLPDNLLPRFLDRSLYESWRRATDMHLEDDFILAPKTPEGLGGEWSPANFQPENIFDYYESMAPIYAKAYAPGGKPKPQSRKRRK